MPFDFLGKVEALSPANLTIREQARLAENPLNLRWRDIFPRVPVNSVKIREISAVDFRPAGGRREWNAQGREVPEILGPIVDAEMVPINPTHHIDERRLQALREPAMLLGAQGAELVNRGVLADVDGWATRLADAVDRQTERDAFEAWFKNEITVMDPKTGTTVTVPGPISSSRYVAASGTFAAATSAYLDFIGYLRDAQATMGSVGAVRMRRARLDEILADAPALSGERMTLAGLGERIAREGFGNVVIVVDERTYDEFDDGGSAYTTKYYVPLDRIAFQPASGVVGASYMAPVTRAQDFGVTGALVKNLQDVVVFHREKNDGKTLMVEAQRNVITLPTEQNVYVVTGVGSAS